MFKIKIIWSISIFSLLIIFTSIIKNQTREIEKNIFSLSKEINLKETDLKESQLDFSYLSSPSMIDKRLENLSVTKFYPIQFSNIFLSMDSFLKMDKKLANRNYKNEKKK